MTATGLDSAATIRSSSQTRGTQHQSKAGQRASSATLGPHECPGEGHTEQEKDPLCTPCRCWRSLSSAQETVQSLTDIGNNFSIEDALQVKKVRPLSSKLMRLPTNAASHQRMKALPGLASTLGASRISWSAKQPPTSGWCCTAAHDSFAAHSNAGTRLPVAAGGAHHQP